MYFKLTHEFQKDFQRLSRKFRSLDDDLVEFKKILSVSPLGIGNHFNIITKTSQLSIIKARFFCKSLRKKDLRLIYANIEKSNIIELVGIEFIEVYFKGDKENEDQERIKSYLKNFS
jgi:hypothetical protein